MLPACLLLVASVSAISVGVNITSTAPSSNSTVAAAGMSTEHQVLTACGVVVVCVILILCFVRYTRLGRQFADKWCYH